MADQPKNAFSPHRLLILGGGSEIGAAFVAECTARGLTHLVLAGRPGGSVDSTAERLRAGHPDLSIETVQFDAAASVTHRERLQSINTAHGPFDAVMVAFGQLGDAFTVDIDPAEAAQLAEVNFSGAVSATLSALQILRGEPGARLIVLSSIIAVRPRVGNLVYGAAKAGLDAFAVELAAPAAELGVELVVVRPGFVHTAMTEGLEPAPFATTADQVATDIVQGLDKGRKVIHSPSPLAPVGLVLKNLPGPIWRRIADR